MLPKRIPGQLPKTLAVLSLPVLVAMGCSTTPEATIPLTTAARPGSATPPIPTAAALDAQFRSVIDPKLPDRKRADLVQDGQAFVGLLPDLYRSMAQYPKARYDISDPLFDNHDGSITATMRLDRHGNGEFQSLPVHFLAIDGKWKLSRTDLCGILMTADYHSTACD